MLVRILHDFTGYPDGTRQHFRAGDTVRVPDGFGRLVVQKGHAERVPDRKPKSNDAAE